MKPYYLIFLSIFAVLVLASESIAQVTIAPTNLFINDQNRFGTFMVINGSNSPQEVNIDFEFSYAITNDAGLRNIVKDSTSIIEYSIKDYVRAFPQQFVIQPGQRQIIRLRINAPNSLDAGTYWARINTSSTAVSSPVEIQNQSNISAQVGILVEQVTGLFYKVGEVETGIEINDIRTDLQIAANQRQLTILTDFSRTGNSPYLGRIKTEVLDSESQSLSESTVSTSYYLDGTHISKIDVTGIKPGDYQLRISFDNQRTDISESDRIPMTPVSKTIPINL